MTSSHQPRKTLRALIVLIVAGSAFLFVHSAHAWQGDLARSADTSSPRATLKSFIEATNLAYDAISRQRYFKRDDPSSRTIVRRIYDCVDDSQLPEFERQDRTGEVVVCIKEILDRVELPPYDEIPDTEMIENTEDGLDRWQIPGTRLTIVQVTEGPRKLEYLFSVGTVDRAIEYYADMKSLPYRTSGPAVSPNFHNWFITAPSGPLVGGLVDMLPEGMKTRVAGLAYWKWIGLVLATLLSLILLVVVYRMQQRYASRFRGDRPYMYCLTVVFPIVAVMIPQLFRYALVNFISLRGEWLYAVTFAANVAALMTGVVLVFSVVNRIVAIILASPRINPQGLDAQFIRIMSKIVSLAISMLVFIEVGHYLGIPVTTLLASAGVGGLAVALAAQDTVKNLFGTIMLMADKPFRVGDRIVVSDYDGVVEDIGLRSTRIRLLTGHQVTIPNDTLACGDVENVGRRPYIRRFANIHIPLDTPRQKIEKALSIIRSALENHEGMSESMPPRVFFDEFNPDSFNIRVMYWYQPAEFWDFLAFSERLNLEIMRAFEDQQIEFSLPSRVSHATFNNEEAPIDVRVLEPPHG